MGSRSPAQIRIEAEVDQRLVHFLAGVQLRQPVRLQDLEIDSRQDLTLESRAFDGSAVDRHNAAIACRTDLAHVSGLTQLQVQIENMFQPGRGRLGLCQYQARGRQ